MSIVLQGGDVIQRAAALFSFLQLDPACVSVDDVRELRMTVDDARQLLDLAEEGLRARRRPPDGINGRTFFTLLEGRLIECHERGIVNENALSDVLGELIKGHALSLDMLATAFGVDTIARLMITSPAPVERSARDREDLYRAAVLAGAGSLDDAELTIQQLRASGVL